MTQTAKGVTSIPRIQQKPQQASDTAIHYGYCAFKDISLAGSVGLEHKVQPADSPYYRNLPARQLIPFTNIPVHEVDEKAAASPSHVRKTGIMIEKQKSAKECAEEMEISYEEWGFRVLRAITGYSEDDAFEIFQTIQPFPYKLKHILSELEDGAIDRIEQSFNYKATYDGETITLKPLRDGLKKAAEAVRQEMLIAAEVAVNKGAETKENTTQSITNFYRGGTGKKRLDPHDKYIFQEFETKPPTLLSVESETPAQAPVYSDSPESLDLKRREVDLREREIVLKEIELGIRPRPEAETPAVKPKVK
jgi:hypothetical protein